MKSPDGSSSTAPRVTRVRIPAASGSTATRSAPRSDRRSCSMPPSSGGCGRGHDDLAAESCGSDRGAQQVHSAPYAAGREGLRPQGNLRPVLVRPGDPDHGVAPEVENPRLNPPSLPRGRRRASGTPRVRLRRVRERQGIRPVRTKPYKIGLDRIEDPDGAVGQYLQVLNDSKGFGGAQYLDVRRAQLERGVRVVGGRAAAACEERRCGQCGNKARDTRAFMEMSRFLRGWQAMP